METYIQISKLNDFTFCPKSIYFHELFGNYNESTYHARPQKEGKINHENIDKGKYSSLKKFLQGMEIYSEQYGLCGKIDIYDSEKKELIERKTCVKQIYDGYLWQLYAQYFCLIEMGYEVKKLFIHSLNDNKRYPIPIPDKISTERFEKLIDDINNFEMNISIFPISESKCQHCIYKSLCY